MDIPVSFKKRMQELLPAEEYQQFLESYHREVRLGLRLNTAKITNEEFVRRTPFSCTRIPWIPNGFFYEAAETPAKHPYYYAGLYYLQEPSAMTPASLLDIEPGDLVLDTCAAPGGKTTELAARTAGEGVVITNDISSSRVKALLKNIERCGYKNTVITSVATDQLKAEFPETFDKILVDAPCSGEGMFRKDPALIKSWAQRGPAYYQSIQQQILLDAADMLKPGGRMVYSTCTFSPDENEAVIQHLLDHRDDMEIVRPQWYEGFDHGHPEWIRNGSAELANTVRIWPHRMDGEGHFVALLHKHERAATAPAIRRHKAAVYRPAAAVTEFLDRLMVQLPELAGDQLTLIGDKLLLLPAAMPDCSALRVLRSGLYLGDIRKGRFTPSQALAMHLNPEQFPEVLTIPADDERVIRYLKGETLDLTGLRPSSSQGWQLVCVDQYPLGWGKVTGPGLKNKYYAGWRYL